MNDQDVSDEDIEEIFQEGGALDPILPESPASVNIKFWIDDYGVMFTMRDNDPIKLADRLEKFVIFIKGKGWQPTWSTNVPKTPPQTPHNAPEPFVPPPAEVPYCPTHDRPMRMFEGRYGRFYKCTFRLTDGTYCNEKSNIK